MTFLSFALFPACLTGTIELGGDSRDSAAPGLDTGVPTDSADPVETGIPDTDPQVDMADGLSVGVHPQIVTVLVANWTQLVAGDTWLSWELDGERHSSPVKPTEVGPASQVVLGLPELTEVPVTLHVRADGVETTLDGGTLSTGTLIPQLRPTLTVLDPTAELPAYLLTSVNTGPEAFFGPCYTVILDQQGRVVWYSLTPGRQLTVWPRVARDGNAILREGSAYYAGGTPSITRMTLSLDQMESEDVPELGLAWDELADGSFVYDEEVNAYQYYLTHHTLDGTDERIWDCAHFMDPYSDAYWACAPNTVSWDPVSNAVIWSMFETSTVVSVGADNGEVQWELGAFPGGLTFDPAEIALELPHNPGWTPEHTLLLTTHVPGSRGEQHIREFAINADSGVATQIWDYVPEAGYYGEYEGEARRLSSGNTLVEFGTDGVMQIVTPEKKVVWEADWANHMTGHFTPIDDLYALDAGWGE